ncbi:MAG TPA: hypothetical protein VFV87_20415, partial [Pirellulaceae bacterium]|nr:hypothetical protein [Pirellulaceae bacterium]
MNLALSASPPPPVSPLLADYRARDGAWDEMRDGGAVRAAWQPLVHSLADLDRAALAGRWEQARRLIHENGVTYNVHGDPEGLARPWE